MLLQKMAYLAAEHGIVKNQSAHVSHLSKLD
jgi:hypothetical protein